MIIILAQTELSEQGPSQEQDVAVQRPVVPIQVQPLAEKSKTEIDKQYFDRLTALVGAFQASDPGSPARDAALEAILSTSYGGGTIKGWLESKLSKKFPEPGEAEQQAYMVVDKAATKMKPGSKFLGVLDGELRTVLSYDRTATEKDTHGVSKNQEIANATFSPYIKWQSGSGGKKIDKDIVENFADLDDQVWAQYKRDAWNDTGNRIEESKNHLQAMVQDVLNKNPQIREQVGQKKLFPIKLSSQVSACKKILAMAGIDPKPIFNDPASPRYLTGEMVEPSAYNLGKSYIIKSRTMMNAKNFNTNLGGECSNPPCHHGENEKEGFEISSKDVERMKGMHGGNVQNIPETEKKETREQLPESYLPPEEEQRQKAEQRRSIIVPANPNFSQVARYITKRMYNPHGSRTEMALYLIGTLMSELEDPMAGGKVDPKAYKINETRRQRILNDNWNLFDEPLQLPDEPEAADEEVGAKARFAMAFNQVMKNMHRFVANDQSYNEMLRDLKLGSVNKAAFLESFMRMIRQAKLAYVAKYAILRGR